MRATKISLFFAILMILGFIGCQNSPDPLSSDNELDKRTTITPVNWEAGVDTCVELVAGQYNVVGTVCIESVTDSLIITYNVTETDWSITETHLAVVNNPSEFPRTRNGNPKVGHFPYGGYHNNVGFVRIAVPTAGLNSLVYIGAHAVVDFCDPNSGTPVLCPELPESDSMTPFWTPAGSDKIIKMDFATLGTYYGWCVDATRELKPHLGAREVKFFCTYDQSFPTCTTFIERPENLDLINWIINHRDPTWGRNTVQAAIWQLINPSGTGVNWQDPNAPDYFWNNPTQREQIVALAMANGEGYTPDCGEKVLIIAYGPGTDPCDPIRQVVVFEKEVECIPVCDSETAWGFPFVNGQPVPGKSALFGSQWARYFSYQR